MQMKYAIKTAGQNDSMTDTLTPCPLNSIFLSTWAAPEAKFVIIVLVVF